MHVIGWMTNNPSIVLQLIIGFSGIVIAVFAYRIQRFQRQDAWLQQFAAAHNKFWENKEMARVRRWLSCTAGYAELKPTLVKRRQQYESAVAMELTDEEFRQMDTLDEFITLNVRCHIMMMQLRNNAKNGIWARLFANFWLHALIDGGRPEVAWYVEQFYPVFFANISEYFERHQRSIPKHPYERRNSSVSA